MERGYSILFLSYFGLISEKKRTLKNQCMHAHNQKTRFLTTEWTLGIYLYYYSFLNVKELLLTICLLLKIYYDLEETEALNSLVDSFRQYLTRNKQLAKAKIKRYGNLFTATKMVYRYKMNREYMSRKVQEREYQNPSRCLVTIEYHRGNNRTWWQPRHPSILFGPGPNERRNQQQHGLHGTPLLGTGRHTVGTGKREWNWIRSDRTWRGDP